jgi:hypothetical protein
MSSLSSVLDFILDPGKWMPRLLPLYGDQGKNMNYEVLRFVTVKETNTWKYTVKDNLVFRPSTFWEKLLY